MAQHEMLMLVAAPLLVLGRPLQAFLWALPPSQRETVGAWTRRPSVSTGWHAASGPAAACALHALALWIWHVPALFEAALADDLVHGLQHASFLVTAALFWWGMVQGRYGRLGYGVSVVYVFVTAVHSSLLGALVTLADGLWYPSYLEDARVWQVDALQDQQLAGLLMWIPSGLVFIGFGLALFAAWLGESERRARLGRAVPPLGLALLLTGTVTACTPSYDADARALTGGEPSRGREAIGRYGCGACHDIPGVRNATGTVGPSLALVARRAYLAGQVSNTPAGMMRWIQHPQQIERGTVMPEMGVTEQDARDITAYLYTLR
jgi:cytochrome c2